MAQVAMYFGHSTMQITMRYPHLVPGANQAGSRAVDAFCENVQATD